LICANLSSIQSLSRAVNQSGYEIKKLFFSGVATSKGLLNNEFKDGINILCDIGSDITEILLFKDGLLKDIEILPIGADNLTMQLQAALEITFDLAEDVKRSYGIISDPQHIPEDKEILLRKGNSYKPIKQRLVTEIVASSIKPICLKIKETVEKKIPLYEVNNFFIVGRAVLLEGFIEALEDNLATPVKLGRITNPQILSLIKDDPELSSRKYLTYLTALGMICEIFQEQPLGILSFRQPAKNLILKTLSRIKEVYQEYF
jgi:cell division protein FtsA